MTGVITGQKTFYDGKEREDVTGVSMPDISPVTASVNMPGGEVELPTTLYGSIKITVKYRGLSADVAAFYDPGVHKLEHRYVQEVLTDGTENIEQLVKVFADVISNGNSAGEPEVGTAQEGEATLEAIRYRVVVEGKEVLNIDKKTGKVVVNGKDRSAKKLSLLG